MNRIIYSILVFIVLLNFTSCRTLTVEEFSEKYDTTEVEGKIIDVWHSATFEFEYDDRIYEILESDPLYLAKGEKYKILIDRNAPAKNFLVLRHKPVFKDTVPLSQFIIKITDISPTNNYIYVQYQIIKINKGTNQIISKEVFFEDIKYLDKIERYKKNKTDVVVDVFSINSLKVSFRINYDKTEELFQTEY